jgi:hypothetical protein
MAKTRVIVQGNNVIFDEDGSQLSPSYEYSVKDSPRIQQYIAEGFVTVVENKTDEKSEVENSETAKKPATQKNSKDQETDSLSS